MPQSAKEMYARMETDRRPFLDRAERAAALTIPSLIPPSGFAQGQSLPDPHPPKHTQHLSLIHISEPTRPY